jgi:hypothetical protein
LIQAFAFALGLTPDASSTSLGTARKVYWTERLIFMQAKWDGNVSP